MVSTRAHAEPVVLSLTARSSTREVNVLSHLINLEIKDCVRQLESNMIFYKNRILFELVKQRTIFKCKIKLNDLFQTCFCYTKIIRSQGDILEIKISSLKEKKCQK